MDYTSRTNENQDRTDKLRYYAKECYVHADTINISETIIQWKQSVTVYALNKYKHHLNGHLCDIGCGFGILPLLLLESGTITSAIGVDYFPQAINVARAFATHLHQDKIQFRQMDFTEEIDLPSNHFDSVMSFHTLEHIYKSDHDKFLHNISKILKPNGIVVVSIPYDHGYGSVEHVSFFKEDSLAQLFNQHKFTTIEIEHLHALNFLTGVFKNGADGGS